MEPHVRSLAYKPADTESKPPDHFARVELEAVVLMPRQGIEGDAKSNNGTRQLNVMFAETVDALKVEGFKTSPGELGEQIVVTGIDPASIVVGTRLRLGNTAVIELAIPRTGCKRFEKIQGRSKESVAGRLGFMARVVIGGTVAIRDRVRVELVEAEN